MRTGGAAHPMTSTRQTLSLNTTNGDLDFAGWVGLLHALTPDRINILSSGLRPLPARKIMLGHTVCYPSLFFSFPCEQVRAHDKTENKRTIKFGWMRTDTEADLENERVQGTLTGAHF